MTDNGSFPDVSILSKLTVPGLTHHLSNCSLCSLHIIRRIRKFLCKLRIQIFQIRKINVHISFQKLQGFCFFIPAGIIHHRNIQTLPPGHIQCLYDLWYIVCTCYQIDVCSSFFLQFQKNLSKPFHTYSPSPAPDGNIMILAETAAQPAPGKEHCPGAFCSGDTGFLPHMKRRSCQINSLIHATEAFFPCPPVCQAFSWTKSTS